MNKHFVNKLAFHNRSKIHYHSWLKHGRLIFYHYCRHFYLSHGPSPLLRSTPPPNTLQGVDFKSILDCFFGSISVKMSNLKRRGGSVAEMKMSTLFVPAHLGAVPVKISIGINFPRKYLTTPQKYYQ